MPLNSYNFRKGVDIPQWEWLAQFPQGPSYHGFGIATDGARFIYAAAQTGTTNTSASTTTLWRFDTWTNGWQYIVNLTSGNRGVDLDYDPVRNVLWVIHGAALTEWRFFNLNLTSITLCGQTVNAFALSAAITPVLPAAADYGATIIVPTDLDLLDPFDSGTVAAGSTATTLVEATTDPGFQAMNIGLYVEYTSGALSGQRRCITSVTNSTTLVTTAFGAAPATGDAWKIVLPKETATAGTASTITKTGAGWPVNTYTNHDVEIISGLGAGQRRRIASNTADTLTLAAAVTGNARTGNWTTAPDATSVFVIKPSSDFAYYQPGSTNANLYRMDIAATTLAWTTLAAMPGTPSSGGDLKFPRGLTAWHLLQIRGNNTSNIYSYNIAANSWTTLNSFAGSETFTTGTASVNIPGKRRNILLRDSTQRVVSYNVVTGEYQPAPMQPYASPSGYDGKRAAYMKTPDGVEWLYFLRAGGQEFFRIALEWM